MKVKRPSGVTVHLEGWEADRLVKEIADVIENHDRQAGYLYPLGLADLIKALKEGTE
jgi:hypothetical protein